MEFSYLQNRELSLDDINRRTLITLEEGSTTRHFFDRLFHQHGLLMKPDIELASISQVLPLVRSNLGIGFVPLRIAEEDILAGHIFRIKLKEEIPARSISLITDDDYEPTDIMKAFTQALTTPDIKQSVSSAENMRKKL
jgi:DNA-binding transcriptional LysR family regulator